MITIPTGELTGLLSDVIPFAYPDDDLPMLNGVRMEWDGGRLHAMTTDRYRIGWSQWDPDDDPDEDIQEDMFTRWGGDDDACNIVISLADAKALVKNFKLPVREAVACPLTLDFGWERLTVARAASTGYSALSNSVEAAGEVTNEYPDLRQILANQDALLSVRGVNFTPKLLADFAKVRPRGSMEMRFTGPKSLVHVSIGERFVGAIMPVRPASPPAEQEAPKKPEPNPDEPTITGLEIGDEKAGPASVQGVDALPGE